MRYVIFILLTLLAIFDASSQVNPTVNFDLITIGLVKKYVHVGTTKQEEVIAAFGSPDNIILRNERELWVYDKMKVETNTATNSSYASILIAGTKSSTTSASISVKAITVMIDFDKNGIVDDLRVRTGGY